MILLMKCYESLLNHTCCNYEKLEMPYISYLWICVLLLLLLRWFLYFRSWLCSRFLMETLHAIFVAFRKCTILCNSILPWRDSNDKSRLNMITKHIFKKKYFPRNSWWNWMELNRNNVCKMSDIWFLVIALCLTHKM